MLDYLQGQNNNLLSYIEEMMFINIFQHDNDPLLCYGNVELF